MSALPDWLLAWFNSPWLPLILCLGAFSDAFIGVSLFVLGEFFFVAGGYLVAQSAQWWIVPLIWAAALLGDILSYFVENATASRLSINISVLKPNAVYITAEPTD